MKIRIFTDGACSGNPGPGGWACVVLKDNEVVKLSGYSEKTTNNQMELFALCQAIEYVINNYDEDYDSVEIVSDSAYCINALNNGWLYNWHRNNWKKSDGIEISNCDLWKQVIDGLKISAKPNGFTWHVVCCSHTVPLSFIKVKGHSGNTFNEMADELARQEILKHR